MMIQYIALPIVGFLIALLIVSVGGGGGAFYVGVLTAFFNISPAVAATTSLATIIPTTAAGAFSHWRAGNVNLRYGLTMLLGGVVGSVAGSMCSSLLPLRFYNKLTAVILILLGIQMAVSFIKKRRKSRNGEETVEKALQKRKIAVAICYGLLAGAMSGLVGLSGGGPVVAGLAVMGCGALETVGTSVLVLLGISVTGFGLHLSLGSVDWKLVGLLVIGTVTGAVVGPVLLKRIDKKKLELVLQPVMLLMTMAMGIVLMLK